jgi:uncharacterized protein YndB with AHSA1/START domain
MWWKILIAVVILIGALLLYATTKPDQFSVVRSININAGPAVVFAELNDFKRWQAWSPWDKMDPAMQRTFSGSSSGVGSIYAWKGNDKVGEGQMEILKSDAPHNLVIKLDFIKPFECHNIAEFTLISSGSSTSLRWEMRGPNLFIGKVMGVFVDMDQMVGKDFETGLANLKKLAEQQPQPVPELPIQEQPPQDQLQPAQPQ